MTTRRHILRLSALACTGLGAYSYCRGIRLPTLHWDPQAIGNQFQIDEVRDVFGVDLIQTSTRRGLNASFRAFSPSPALNIINTSSNRKKFTISISNIASQAQLTHLGDSVKISETADKTIRTLNIELPATSEVSLQWQLPSNNNYTFASIGDTGGDKELHWCIDRAYALGAKFLLHLGDFNYQEGDYQRSIDAFNNAPIPVYVSIGNHDFHDDGAIYKQFMREIGPLNNVFHIGKTRFVNIDTAANVLPYDAGQRGEMFKLMEQDNNYVDTVAFTHRPLHDPSEDSHHDLGSTGERDWLINALKKVGATTLLSGHIHIYDRTNFNGIDNIIVGQGLGHQDLLINGDASKMILGHVDENGAVRYSPEPLAMPLEAHCHPRVDVVKESLRNGEHEAILNTLEEVCSS